MRDIDRHKALALADPTFDPDRQMRGQHAWWADRLMTAVLTCNVGME